MIAMRVRKLFKKCRFLLTKAVIQNTKARPITENDFFNMKEYYPDYKKNFSGFITIRDPNMPFLKSVLLLNRDEFRAALINWQMAGVIKRIFMTKPQKMPFDWSGFMKTRSAVGVCYLYVVSDGGLSLLCRNGDSVAYLVG